MKNLLGGPPLSPPYTRPTSGGLIDADEDDYIVVQLGGLGRALLNTIHFEEPAARRVAAAPL